MPEEDATLARDTDDDDGALYERIDELLAEIDETCEFTRNGFDADEVELELPALVNPTPNGDQAEPSDGQPAADADADAVSDDAPTQEAPTDASESEVPAAPPVGGAVGVDVDFDMDAGDLEWPEHLEQDSSSLGSYDAPPADNDDAGIKPDTRTPSVESNEEADDRLLDSINQELSKSANAPAASEPEEATTADAADDDGDYSVDFDASDLDGVMAELDAQGDKPASEQLGATYQPSAPEPSPEPTTEPAPESAAPAPTPEPSATPAPAVQAAPAAETLPAADSDQPKAKRDWAPFKLRAYTLGTAAMKPAGTLIAGQPRSVRDTIGWIGLITLFYAAILWLAPVLFGRGGEPTPESGGVRMVDSATQE